MVIGILNFGEGLLAVNYFIFCLLTSLGVLQLAAAHARLIGLMALAPDFSRWLGLAILVAAYAWFFAVEPDLFIPGLAGGEFFALFLVAFGLALVIALLLGTVSSRLFTRASLRPARAELISLRDNFKADLWEAPKVGSAPVTGEADRRGDPPLVLALREAPGDSLDRLSRELHAAGASVLLCDQAALDAALEYVEQNGACFHPSRWYAVGVGRGADAVLQLAADDRRFRAVLALGPFGVNENARPGLRWLQETDYLTAFRLTFARPEICPSPVSRNALVVCGDEDALIQPEHARQLFPGAVMVAGARHFTLARTPAAVRLASDLFQLHRPAAQLASETAREQLPRSEAVK